ncbi:MAG: PQQ-binding-like beta-propeller repeat protein [Pseudomonas sp.]
MIHSSTFRRGATALALCLLLPASVSASSRGDWRHPAGDAGTARYSPLAQIHAGNVGALRVAWRSPALDPALRERFPDLVTSNNYRASPVVVDDTLYISNAIGLVQAHDPGTGALRWTQPLPAEEQGESGPGGGAARGVGYWGKGRHARIISVRGSYLYALDAATGQPLAAFGDGGRIDLRDGRQDLRYRWIAPNPIVVGDVVVVGGVLARADADDLSRALLAGTVRGFDVRSGRPLWTFDTVPGAGQPGAETWLDGSLQDAGKVYVWANFSADETLGLVYAPLSAPSNDWYGGRRPGNNLYSDSLVAIDVRSGRRVWHQQLVHHDLWDYDLPAAPVVARVRVDGRKRRAVLQVTKTAQLFAFDAATGQPLWPIEERPVPASTVPGEWTSPTQPFPLKPAPFDRQGLAEDDLIDFTPELRAEAKAILDRYVHGPIYSPPSIKGENGKLGTLFLPGWVGGANWTGAAVDPEQGVLYVPSVTVPFVIGLEPDGRGGYKRARESSLYLDGPRGLPLVKPPYGRITAIDLDSGEHLWAVPNGDGPRDHPAIAHLKLPPLGQPGRAAPLLTRSLLFLGESDKVGLSMPPFAGGNHFRAYDKQDGKVLWEIDLGAGTTAAPATYLHRGRQYVVVGIGGSEHPAELVALALP